jgi:hypothetical protein
MKKFTLVLCLIALIFASEKGFSQSTTFTFGPKIGFSTSAISTDIDTLTEKFKQGLMGGVFFRFSSKFFYLQPEVLMVSKGGVFESETQTFKQTVSISSVDVPLMIGVRLLPTEDFCIRFHGGPMFSYIVNKSIDINGNNVSSAVADQQLKDAYVGYQAGLGVDILQFSIDFRLEQGLGDIHHVVSGAPDDKWKPRLYNVSLALKLL